MNNNQWEVLTKLIIPAILLVFWAINQIFRKDLTAPRIPKNLQPGDEPIPPGAPARRAAAQPTAPRPQVNRQRPMGRDDDIVIISSENRAPTRPQQAGPPRPASPRSSSGGGSDRSAKRPRPAAGGSRSSQPKKRTAPGDLMTGLQGDQTLMIGALSEVRGLDQVHFEAGSAARQVHLEAGSAAMLEPHRRADTTELTSHASLIDIRKAFRSPARLREAILMSDLLQPPVSRRRSRR